MCYNTQKTLIPPVAKEAQTGQVKERDSSCSEAAHPVPTWLPTGVEAGKRRNNTETCCIRASLLCSPEPLQPEMTSGCAVGREGNSPHHSPAISVGVHYPHRPATHAKSHTDKTHTFILLVSTCFWGRPSTQRCWCHTGSGSQSQQGHGVGTCRPTATWTTHVCQPTRHLL